MHVLCTDYYSHNVKPEVCGVRVCVCLRECVCACACVSWHVKHSAVAAAYINVQCFKTCHGVAHFFDEKEF